MPAKQRQTKKSKPSSSSRNAQSNASQSLKSSRSGTFNIFLVLSALLGFASSYYYIYLRPGASSSLLDESLYDPGILRDRTFFEVVDIPGKGKGAVAVKDIKQGELIIREAPLVLLASSLSVSPQQYLHNVLATLSPAQRSAFFNLSSVGFPSDLDPSEHEDDLALAIVQTNSVAAGVSNVGVFPRMARANHGCSRAFNAVYTWREEEGNLVVHALKEIKKGEEILTVYMDTKRPRAERREFLKEHYGFECNCSVCSLPQEESEVSDKRLSEIAALYAKFSTWGTKDIEGKEALDHVRKIWEIEDEEGYCSERGRLAADASWVASAHSDVEAAKQWATLSIQWFGYELGSDSRQVKEMQGVAERPESHPGWATRNITMVGGPSLA